MNNQFKILTKISQFVGKPTTRILALLLGKFFQRSPEYWDFRYQIGGTSGTGSYGRLAEFKAEVLNSFVADNRVESVIEFGCGDGNQLSFARYPHYIGLDVSKTAIGLCKERFREDLTKSFFLYDPLCFVDNHDRFCADLAVSLDVIYHLIEDEIYEAYMTHLFNSAKAFVIIYSTDHDEPSYMPHVKQRHFSSWVSSNHPTWSLIKKINNRYPPGYDDGPTSLSDFFIFGRI